MFLLSNPTKKPGSADREYMHGAAGIQFQFIALYPLSKIGRLLALREPNCCQYFAFLCDGVFPGFHFVFSVCVVDGLTLPIRSRPVCIYRVTNCNRVLVHRPDDFQHPYPDPVRRSDAVPGIVEAYRLPVSRLIRQELRFLDSVFRVGKCGLRNAQVTFSVLPRIAYRTSAGAPLVL